MQARMKVEIWSDIVWAWCYIGKRRLETVFEGLDHRADVAVEFRSFELNPNAPAQQEGNLEGALARKYGVSLEQARAMNARVVDAAAGEGLHYRYGIAKRANTFDAHRLIPLAAAEGLHAPMKQRRMAASFIERPAIGDRDTLVELADAA